MNESYPMMEKAYVAGTIAGGQSLNPTLRENIEAKIQYHRDEIARLEKLRDKIPTLLDINLRDLREAMSF